MDVVSSYSSDDVVASDVFFQFQLLSYIRVTGVDNIHSKICVPLLAKRLFRAHIIKPLSSI
jgi:hypothetical protein